MSKDQSLNVMLTTVKGVIRCLNTVYLHLLVNEVLHLRGIEEATHQIIIHRKEIVIHQTMDTQVNVRGLYHDLAILHHTPIQVQTLSNNRFRINLRCKVNGVEDRVKGRGHPQCIKAGRNILLISNILPTSSRCRVSSHQTNSNNSNNKTSHQTSNTLQGNSRTVSSSTLIQPIIQVGINNRVVLT